MPPRLFVQEMKFDMLCPVEAYLARDAVTCYDLAMRQRESHPPCLAELCEALLDTSVDSGLSKWLDKLSILNLFIVILGISESFSSHLPLLEAYRVPRLTPDSMALHVHPKTGRRYALCRNRA